MTSLLRTLSRVLDLVVEQTNLAVAPAGPPLLVDICDIVVHIGESSCPHSLLCSSVQVVLLTQGSVEPLLSEVVTLV